MNFPIKLSDPLCLDNIKACCAASQLAYSQSTITDSSSGESVLIQDCGDCTLIAFPGTHDLRDVLRDIDCLRLATMILGQPCAVHAGFNRTHNALIAEIVGRLQSPDDGSSAESGTSPLATARGAKHLSFFGNLAEGELSEAATPLSDSSTSPVASTEIKKNQARDSSPAPTLGERVGEGLAQCATDEKRTTGDDSVFGELVNQREIPSRKISGQGSALFLTGHSKGAAVARRCALALLEKNFPVAGLITFGEPRGGDARYAAICNHALADRTLRLTNAADPVPWLPAWLAGNRHCGPEGWLPSDTQPAARNPKLVFGPRLWLQLLLNSAEIFRAWQLKDLAPLADHHIDNYLRRVDAL